MLLVGEAATRGRIGTQAQGSACAATSAADRPRRITATRPEGTLMISLNRHVLARTLASAAVSLVFLLASASASYAVTTNRVDGQGGGGGRILAHISGDTAGVGRSGVPWVFYGANPGAGWRLRLAKLAAGTAVYETLDGTGGANGRTGDSVGSDVSAVQLNGVPNVFYYDDTMGAL